MVTTDRKPSDKRKRDSGPNSHKGRLHLTISDDQASNTPEWEQGPIHIWKQVPNIFIKN